LIHIKSLIILDMTSDGYHSLRMRNKFTVSLVKKLEGQTFVQFLHSSWQMDILRTDSLQQMQCPRVKLLRTRQVLFLCLDLSSQTNMKVGNMSLKYTDGFRRRMKKKCLTLKILSLIRKKKRL